LEDRSLYAQGQGRRVVDPHAGTVVSEGILWGNFVKDQPVQEGSCKFQSIDDLVVSEVLLIGWAGE
jgi:hypothetical protein